MKNSQFTFGKEKTLEPTNEAKEMLGDSGWNNDRYAAFALDDSNSDPIISRYINRAISQAKVCIAPRTMKNWGEDWSTLAETVLNEIIETLERIQ